MEGGAINYVAWWGAIIATLLLIWDVMKWFKSGARIRALAWSNVWYMDGEVTKSEKVEGGVSIELICRSEAEVQIERFVSCSLRRD